jgi:hypothetical protein
MKKLMVVVLFLLFSLVLLGQQVVEIPELMKPEKMIVDGGDLIVVEKTTIYIFSLKDFKLKAKFGKEGEGPQEFKVNPFGGPGVVAVPYPDHLLVNSEGKVSYFTREGKFIRGRKAPPTSVIMPVKDKFLSNAFNRNDKGEMHLSVVMLDKDFKKLKELYVSDITVGPNAKFNLPYNLFSYFVYKDKIYMAVTGDGIAIDVLDGNGKKLYRINKKVPVLKVDKAYETFALNWMKNDSPFKMYFDYIKKNIKFKTVYPPMKEMVVVDDKIYALTYKKKKDLSQIIVMDLKGKELKEVYLPLVDVPPMIPHLYSIDGGKYYTLIEDLDEEVWMLHIHEIK